MSKLRNLSCQLQKYDPATESFRTETVFLTPARHDSFFSRISLFSSTRRKLLRQVDGLLSKDYELIGEKRHRTMKESRVYREMDKHGQSLRAAESNYANVSVALRSFSNRTLSLILEEFSENDCEGITIFLHGYLEYPESLLREAACYRAEIENLPAYLVTERFNDVRKSCSKFMLEDLTELEGNERSQAAAILKVSSSIYWGYSMSQRRMISVSPTPIFACMTPELASVIMDHVDRTEDISFYLESRSLTVHSIDTDHLVDWLHAPAPSISSGIL